MVARLVAGGIFYVLLGMAAANATPIDQRTDVICAYAPSQSAAVNRISASIVSAGTGAAVTLKAAGLAVVPHVAGGHILTGAGGYVAGTMAGASAVATVLPATVFVGGVAIAVELACAPKNHPNLVRKVLTDSKAYWTGATEKVDEFFATPKDGDTLRQTGDYWAQKIEQYMAR